MTPDLVQQAARLIDLCRAQGLRLATAESCTGGLLAATLTEVAGSSDVVDRGYVVYANRAKIEMLGVRAESLARFGAVSETVAREMAEGALAQSGCDLAVAITGIAGPGGGTPEKPVGLVHFAAARRGFATRHERHLLAGDRHGVRLTSVGVALRLLEALARAPAAV
jgi:nicotinamide-nucleotide amidase